MRILSLTALMLAAAGIAPAAFAYYAPGDNFTEVRYMTSSRSALGLWPFDTGLPYKTVAVSSRFASDFGAGAAQEYAKPGYWSSKTVFDEHDGNVFTIFRLNTPTRSYFIVTGNTKKKLSYFTTSFNLVMKEEIRKLTPEQREKFKDSYKAMIDIQRRRVRPEEFAGQDGIKLVKVRGRNGYTTYVKGTDIAIGGDLKASIGRTTGLHLQFDGSTPSVTYYKVTVDGDVSDDKFSLPPGAEPVFDEAREADVRKFIRWFVRVLAGLEPEGKDIETMTKELLGPRY